MPRYLVERNYPDGLGLPINEAGARLVATVISNNLQEGVTWVHSYVTPDRKKSYCIYDAPNPEAIRTTAQRSGLPADRIEEVRVLDPYFLK